MLHRIIGEEIIKKNETHPKFGLQIPIIPHRGIKTDQIFVTANC